MKQFLSFLLRLNWAQKLTVFAIVAVVISLVFKTITPQQAETQSEILTNVADLQTSLNNITFSGKAPQINETMNVGKVDNYQLNKNEIKQIIIDKLQLQQETGSTTTWSNNNYIFQDIPQTEQLILFQKDTPNENEQDETTFTQESVGTTILATDTFVKEIFGTTAPTRVESQTRYKTNDLEPADTNSIAEAHAIYIPYSYQLDGYPIFLNSKNYYVATILVDAQQRIIKAEIYPYTLSVSPTRSYKTLSVSLAMSNINNNNAALVYTDSFGTNKILNIASGDLTTADIQYRADISTSTVVPYYHFTGSLKDTSGNPVVGELITPAVQTNFDNPLRQ